MKNSIVVKISLIVGLGLLGLIYLIGLLASIYEVITIPQQPIKVTLDQAIEIDRSSRPTFLFFEKSLYVIITDAKWECASVQNVNPPGSTKDHTDGVFTNANGVAVVFVQIEGLYSCQELQSHEIAGELQRFTRRPVEYQSDENGRITIDDKSEVITFSLCTHCTPSDARSSAVFLIFFPFIMWFIFENGKRKQRKKVE